MGGEGRPGLVGGDVLDHHDRPARLAQVRRRGLRDEEAALRGCAEGEFPVRLAELEGALRSEALRRGVDEEVEAPELGDTPLDERSRLVGSRDVAVGPACCKNRPTGHSQPLGDR